MARKYITRIGQLYALSNFNQIYTVQSMRAHKVVGSKTGEEIIVLTGQWRLIVTKGQTEEEVVVELVSNHYGD